MPAFKPPGQCPNCGEWVPRGAVACDDCGACAKSGWKADADSYEGVDLPDDPDDFDYDEFLQREFGEDRQGRTSLSKEHWWKIVAAILLVVMVLGYLLSAR